MRKCHGSCNSLYYCQIYFFFYVLHKWESAMEFAIVFITAKYKEQNIKCITLLVFLIVCGLCCRYLLVEVSAWRVQTGAVHLSVFSRMERGRLQYVVSHTSFTRYTPQVAIWSEMELCGKSVCSWCDGLSDRSSMGWTH